MCLFFPSRPIKVVTVSVHFGRYSFKVIKAAVLRYLNSITLNATNRICKFLKGNKNVKNLY